jgi:predicted enzyme related to lactoylglutathione lyase
MPEVTTVTPNKPIWIDLSSPDLEASKKFYGQIFGWDAQQVGGPEMANYTFFRLRGKQIAGGASIMGPGQHPAWTTYIGVDDADATVAKIKSSGGEVVMGPDEVPGSGRMVIFRDPTGAYIALWQPGGHKGSQIVMETGAFTWTELLTRDLPRAKQFYKDVFGWDTSGMPMGSAAPQGAPENAEYTIWQLNGDGFAGGMDMPGAIPPQVPAFWQVYFGVDDVDTSAEQITQLGGTAMVPPMDFPGGRLAVFTDPQGATFGIMRGTT